MVKKLFYFLGKETSGLHQAAYLLGFFTFLSQLLGLVRDRIFAAYFGAGHALDVYYAAFRIPDLIFVTVSSLVSATVLIPLLARIDTETRQKSFISSVYTIFVIFIGCISLAAHYWMPELLQWAVPGINDPILLSMSRLLLWSPFILGLSNLCGGIVQSKNRFAAYALSPVFYNLGIIIGVLFLYPVYGFHGIALGVILGSCMHLAIQLPTLSSFGMLPRLTWRINWKEIGEVFSLSLPRTFALASGHLVNLGLVALGSLMAVGSISIFTFALNMQSVPLSIIGVSYSLAAFPALARFWSEGRQKEFFAELSAAAKHVLFWSIPVIVLFIVLRAQVVRTVYGSGLFDWDDTRLTAAALALFSLSLVAQNITLLCVRAHYAMGHTRKPFLFALIGAVFSGLVAILGLFIYKDFSILYGFFESLFKVSGIRGTEVLILPFAFSIGSALQAVLLWYSMPYAEFRHAFNIGRSVFQSFSASVIMGYVAYLMLNALDDVFDLDTLIGIFSQGFFAGTVGIVAGAIILVLLGNQEIRIIWQTLHTRIWKTKPVLTENPPEIV